LIKNRLIHGFKFGFKPHEYNNNAWAKIYNFTYVLFLAYINRNKNYNKYIFEFNDFPYLDHK